MSVKEQILKDIKSIESPQLLHQLFEYLQVVKRKEGRKKPNRKAVLEFAGTITNAEAKRLGKSIDQAFNHIEGEW